MATTCTVLGVDQLKGDMPGNELHAYQIPVLVTGTYLTATKPSFDVLAALQNRHQGIASVAVKSAVLLRDGSSGTDGTNRYTASNAVIALSGTGNKTVTFTIESGATNGDTGTEVADTTALNHTFVFLVVAQPS